jgi:hypothetical protein
MRVCKTRWFVRCARRAGITDARLMEAVARAERGLVDADLGGGLIKQRVARDGKGKSGGYRTLIAYRKADRAFFVFGFAKSRMENPPPDELGFARSLGEILMEASGAWIAASLMNGDIEEI